MLTMHRFRSSFVYNYIDISFKKGVRDMSSMYSFNKPYIDSVTPEFSDWYGFIVGGMNMVKNKSIRI